MAEGDYILNVADVGDLTKDKWTIDDSHQVEFKVGSGPFEVNPSNEWTLSGDKSIVGLGVTIAKKDAPNVISRGVIGINSAGANSKRSGVRMASCVLQSTANSALNITGLVEIRRVSSATRVRGRVSGLRGGLGYGFHIHEYGDLGSKDGMSTKGHYNPLQTTHKLPGGTQAGHVGDLGNIAYYDNAGNAWYDEMNISLVELVGSNVNVLGRAIVVHSQMDNGCEQPTGGAGARLAFCVIGVSDNNAFFAEPPFAVPPQRGSAGCSLENTPTNVPRSASFVWITVVICLALVAIGGLFAFNWWRSRNNPNSTDSGARPWYAHQAHHDEDS